MKKVDIGEKGEFIKKDQEKVFYFYIDNFKNEMIINKKSTEMRPI